MVTLFSVETTYLGALVANTKRSLSIIQFEHVGLHVTFSSIV